MTSKKSNSEPTVPSGCYRARRNVAVKPGDQSWNYYFGEWQPAAGVFNKTGNMFIIRRRRGFGRASAGVTKNSLLTRAQRKLKAKKFP